MPVGGERNGGRSGILRRHSEKAFRAAMVGAAAIAGSLLAPVAASAAAHSSAGGAYHALPPSRICDTRPTSVSGLTDQCTGKTLTAGSTLPVQVAGKGGVPASGVSAVVLNVTVTDTTSGGYLTLWPTGQSR
ncbi:MAG: hypothetical protein M0035_13475, partial [Actinomycetota bacterium]|nr:hypothetical protein [Actinomycetota bacterium]